MHKITQIFVLVLVFLVFSCEQVQQSLQKNLSGEDAKKEKLAGQLAELGCQDTRDFISQYGAKLIPLLGDILVDKLIDKNGEGEFCECMKPILETELKEKYALSDLEALITERQERRSIIKVVMLNERKRIIECYKENGKGKGVKFVEKVMDKMAKKMDDIEEKAKEEIEKLGE